MSLRDIFDVVDTSTDARTFERPTLPNNSRQISLVLSRYERQLWVLTLAAMAVDVTLTVYGLQLGLRELNPVARGALEQAGVFGLYGLKLWALLLGAVCVSILPDRYTPFVPLGLVVPSSIAVLINTAVIGFVVL